MVHQLRKYQSSLTCRELHICMAWIWLCTRKEFQDNKIFFHHKILQVRSRNTMAKHAQVDEKVAWLPVKSSIIQTKNAN